MLAEKEDLIITCESGITLRTSISTIKTAGRNTQGVILIRLDSGDAIAAISKIEETETEEEMVNPENNEQLNNNTPTENSN
jgi:DNA gyrase subunit A